MQIDQPDGGPRPTSLDSGSRLARRLLWLAIAVSLAVRLALLPRRILDPDELEHAHAAWSVFRGLLPYRDFFEHHTPWYHYALRPFFRLFAVDQSFASATRFFLFGRGLSFVLTVVSVWLVDWMGRLWADRRTGLIAGLLLVNQPFFLQKTLEMRPDVLALPFFLGAMGLLVAALRAGGDAARARARTFFAAGLCLGAAIMCTQKMLFVLPGAFAALGVRWLFPGREIRDAGRNDARTRVAALTAFVLGMAVPIVATWTFFAFHHAGGEFIANNFLLNARWKHFVTRQFWRLLGTSGPLLALALLGAGVFVWRFRRQRRHDGLLLLAVTVGLFLGVLVMPVPHRQYYLMPLPLVALFAAQGLLLLIDRARERRRPAALAVSLILLDVLPAVSFAQSFRQQRNDVQRARLRFVFDHTRAADPVMDGWEGMGVFRPHAFEYFFLHEEVIAMLPPRKLDAYLDDLEGGKIRPALIAMDRNLWTLGPRFVDFVTAHYQTNDGFFYRPKTRSD